jgi:activator of 2-hydroxyglutaryl-CoA dehydratase
VSKNLFFGGVDIGASATKAAVINSERQLLASDIRKTGVSFETCAQEAMDAALASCGLEA